MDRTCITCKQIKNDLLFSPKGRSCRSCSNAFARKYRANLTPEQKRAKSLYVMEWRAKHPEYKSDPESTRKSKIRRSHSSSCSAAIRKGRKVILVAIPFCIICGSKEQIEAHHWSYLKEYKYSVVFVCKSCHLRIHKDPNYYPHLRPDSNF